MTQSVRVLSAVRDGDEGEGDRFNSPNHMRIYHSERLQEKDRINEKLLVCVESLNPMIHVVFSLVVQYFSMGELCHFSWTCYLFKDIANAEILHRLRKLKLQFCIAYHYGDDGKSIGESGEMPLSFYGYDTESCSCVFAPKGDAGAIQLKEMSFSSEKVKLRVKICIDASSSSDTTNCPDIPEQVFLDEWDPSNNDAFINLHQERFKEFHKQQLKYLDQNRRLRITEGQMELYDTLKNGNQYAHCRVVSKEEKNCTVSYEFVDSVLCSISPGGSRCLTKVGNFKLISVSVGKRELLRCLYGTEYLEYLERKR
eukprot:Nk52_evm10s2273 gene=Nk52_evmTU10s2273